MGCWASKDPARPDPGAVQMHGAQGASEAGTLETNKAPTTVATPRSSGKAPRDNLFFDVDDLERVASVDLGLDILGGLCGRLTLGSIKNI